jgi:hypothetical protein
MSSTDYVKQPQTERYIPNQLKNEMIAAKFCSSNISKWKPSSKQTPCRIFSASKRSVTGYIEKPYDDEKRFTKTQPFFMHVNKAKDIDFIKEFASKQNLVSKIVSTTLQKITNDYEAIALKERVNFLKSKKTSTCSSVKTSKYDQYSPFPKRKNIILQSYHNIPISHPVTEGVGPSTPKLMQNDFFKLQNYQKKVPLYLYKLNPLMVPNSNKYDKLTFETLNTISTAREKLETRKKRFKF